MHKRVRIELECLVPVGVGINELIVRKRWYGPSITTKKYMWMYPDIRKIRAKYIRREDKLDPTSIG